MTGIPTHTATITRGLWILGLCGLGLAAWQPAAAGDWPQFRGPNGNGISAEAHAPIHWGKEKNIAWKTSLPRPGNGSPIVVGDRVFLACAEDAQGKRRSLYCFSARTGKQQWVRTVSIERVMPTHKTNPYCGSTPACDGERVVVWHGSAGLHCYDLKGNPLWSRDLGEYRHMWGYGTSPVLFGDQVILHTGPGARVMVTAIDIRSGKTRWETEEPVEYRELGRNRAGKYEGSWSTPVRARIDGKSVLVCTMPTRVTAYDPDTGKLVWWCRGIRGPRGDLAYSSPIIGEKLGMAIGGYNGPAIGFRLQGTGDVTESHRLWRVEQNPQSIGTGVWVGDHVYRINAARPAPIECLDPKTGEVIWKSDPKGGICWSSLVVVGDLGYVTNRTGTTLVFRIDPRRYVEVARNDLGESCHATPAVSNGRIFIRTFEHLICIEDERT